MKFVIELLVVAIFGIILFFLVRGLINDIRERRQIKLEEKKVDVEEKKEDTK